MSLARQIVERIARSVRATEAAPTFAGAGAATLDGSLRLEDFGGWHNWVRTTTTSPDANGHYSGKWCQFNPADNTLTDQISILVREVRGGKLKQTDTTGATVYYFARYEGDWTDGTPIYVPVSEASSYQTVTGTTDYGTSSAAGTSPPGVLSLPTLTGTSAAPSWTPAANTYPVEWNQTSKTLYAYDGTNWYGVAGGAITVAPTYTISTATTNAAVTVDTEIVKSTGSVAVNFGGKNLYELVESGATTVALGYFSWQFTTTATAATYNTTLTYGVTDHSTTTNYFTVVSTAGAVVNTVLGQLTGTATGATNTAPTGYLTFATLTVTGTPTSTLPAGTALYDTIDKKLWVSDGGGSYTAINAGGSALTGSLTSGRVPFANGSSSLTDDSAFLYTVATHELINHAPNAGDVAGSFSCLSSAATLCDDSTGNAIHFGGGPLDANDDGSSNFTFGTTNGSQLGTTTAQKLALWGAAPVSQPNTTGTTTGFTAGTGTTVHDDSTFTGGTGSTAYRISDVVLALKQLGALAT